MIGEEAEILTADRPWRLLSVGPAAEFKVLEAMRERRLKAYVPVETVWAGAAHRRRVYARPLIRGYLFARLAYEDQPTAAHLPGVSGLFASAGPYQLQRLEKFVVELQAAEAAGLYDKTRPKETKFKVGDHVRITGGVWNGHVAVIAEMRPQRRVELVTSLFAQAGRCVVKLSQLELAA